MKQRRLNKLWIVKLYRKNATELAHKTMEILVSMKRRLMEQQIRKKIKILTTNEFFIIFVKPKSCICGLNPAKK